MINKPNEEEQLAIVVKNLLPRYHKFLFAQNFLNFKALIAVGTQIEDAINNGIIKNEDGPKFKRNFGPSSSKTTKVSNVYKTNPYQLIVPVQISQGPPTRPRREFHELYMPASQVFEKIESERVTKTLRPTYGGRHFKAHIDNLTPTYGGRHFKPQDIEPSDLSKIAYITRLETH